MQVTQSRLQLSAYLLFLGVVFALPLFLDIFWLNRIAIYLVYAIAGAAMSMAWGYGGVLNLGQGVFFGLGAYMIAISLTLASPSSDPVPDFMILNAQPDAPQELCCIVPGSFLWIPFQSQWFGVLLGMTMPALLAFVIGYPMFRRRTTGVYVAIITLALALIVQLLIVNNQPLTNGFNGLADFGFFTVGGIEFEAYATATYLLIASVLSIVLLGGRWLLRSRAGLILRATQDNEDRGRYLGYEVEKYKLFFFCLSTAIAGLAGMLFVLVSEFASPALMAIPFSISMVIWAAVGGRNSLLGASIGAILVNMVEASASESEIFQPVWPIILGGLFIGVVLFFPAGIAGYTDKLADRLLQRRKASVRSQSGRSVASQVVGNSE